MNELQKLQAEINELKTWKKNMESSFTIPFSVDQAIRERFPMLMASSKNNDTEDQSVHEGGTEDYNVAKQYDDFLEVKVDGFTYYVGVYTSLT